MLMNGILLCDNLLFIFKRHNIKKNIPFVNVVETVRYKIAFMNEVAPEYFTRAFEECH